MADLRNELESLKSDANQYFDAAVSALKEMGHNFRQFPFYSGPEQRELLPDPLRKPETS
jgi:hypothetical protein